MRPYLRAVSLAVFLTATLAISTHCCAAEVSFEFPVLSTFSEVSVNVDLGTPAARVNSILLTVAGTGRATQYWVGDLGDSTDCSAPYVVPMDFSVFVFSGEAYAWEQWQLDSNGNFSFSDDVFMNSAANGLFADGRAQLKITERANEFNFLYWYVGMGHRFVGTCVAGELVFNQFPVLTVNFDPAVPNAQTSWGRVKAIYR